MSAIRIAQINSEIDELQSEISLYEDEIDNLENEDEIDNLENEDEIDNLENKVSRLERELAKLEAQGITESISWLAEATVVIPGGQSKQFIWRGVDILCVKGFVSPSDQADRKWQVVVSVGSDVKHAAYTKNKYTNAEEAADEFFDVIERHQQPETRNTEPGTAAKP